MSKRESTASPAESGHEMLHSLIGEQVMQVLGQPGDLCRVQVRRLWADRFRVNVLVGPNAVSVRVAHSFFLVTDPDGNIITSAPKLTRHY